MAPLYLIFVLLVQCSVIYADERKNETESVELVSEVGELQNSTEDAFDVLKNSRKGDDEESRDDPEKTIQKSDNDDLLLKDFRTATTDWVDMFLGSSPDLYPSSSTALMSQATNSNKSPEEQLEEIKEVANEITMAIQSEMANLLSYALNYVDKDIEDNKQRKKRSIETPMDSSQLVMRLLKHIKCNNEYQNIAIEKMMSAQEIADKYGVEFCPDPEILSDLAFAANEQAKELTSILQDACDTKNSSCIAEISSSDISENCMPTVNTTNMFAKDDPDYENITNSVGHDHIFQTTWDIPTTHIHYLDNHIYNPGYNYYDTQIPSTPVQHSYGAPVSQKPSFYDSISYNPNEYNAPYCSMDPMSYFSTYPLEDHIDLEPELIGEEYEETISSKVIIEQDEDPGSATVNHVMTYTVSEKAHFRTPQIEKLPQQMQYYFFLM